MGVPMGSRVLGSRRVHLIPRIPKAFRVVFRVSETARVARGVSVAALGLGFNTGWVLASNNHVVDVMC